MSPVLVSMLPVLPVILVVLVLVARRERLITNREFVSSIRAQTELFRHPIAFNELPNQGRMVFAPRMNTTEEAHIKPTKIQTQSGTKLLVFGSCPWASEQRQQAFDAILEKMGEVSKVEIDPKNWSLVTGWVFRRDTSLFVPLDDHEKISHLRKAMANSTRKCETARDLAVGVVSHMKLAEKRRLSQPDTTAA